MKPNRSWLPQGVRSRLWNALQNIRWSVHGHCLTTQGELLWRLLLFNKLHIVVLNYFVVFSVSWPEPGLDKVVGPT